MDIMQSKAKNFVSSNTSSERKNQVEYIAKVFEKYPECRETIENALSNDKDFDTVCKNIKDSIEAIEDAETELDNKVDKIKDAIKLFGNSEDLTENLKSYFTYKFMIKILTNEKENIIDEENKFSSKNLIQVVDEKYCKKYNKEQYNKTIISSFLTQEQTSIFDYIFDDIDKEESDENYDLTKDDSGKFKRIDEQGREIN